MAYKVTFNKEAGIIEAKLEGVIASREIKEVISEATANSQRTQCFLWLSDYSEATTAFYNGDI